jgi:hypothetical protein
MLKKFVVGAIAAGVLAVPLAGVAGADPSRDNPGTPGNIGGNSPGSLIEPFAKMPGVSTSQAFSDLTDGAFPTPGSAVKEVNPAHSPI